MNVLEYSSKRTASIAVATVLLFGLIGAAATRTSFAAPTNSGIVIPLYTYPTDGSWAATLQAKNAHPNVPIIAVINPNNGPGGSSDSNYVQGVKNFQAAGIIVLGYVATGYASHAMSNLDAEINSYWNLYRVNGIFFDEMANNQGNENYYSTLNTYVKSLGMTMTMGNPGTSVPSSYIGTLDSLCIFEQGGLPTLSYLSSYSGHPKSNFAYIGLSVSSLSTSYETSSSNYVQWIYITDAGGGNPYNVLPSYFMNEVAALDAGGQTTTSTSTTTSRTTTTATGTAATLSISTVDSSNQPLSGFYIQEIKDNTAGTSTAGTYTPQTVDAVVGHSYSVTVDDYSTRYVEGANMGTFARNTVVPQSGTTTFTLQGVTNLVFTEALLATSASTSTTTTTSKTTTTTTTSHTTTSTSTTTTSSTRTATSTTSPRTTTVTSKTTSPTTTRITATSTTTQAVPAPTPTGAATLYQDTFKAVDLFGLPISGATVKVTAANGTQITKPTDGNGVASFDLPNGTYSADVSYMGVTSSTADQSSGSHSITVTFILSFPIVVVASLFGGTLAAVVVARRLHRGKAALGPSTF